VQAFSATLFKTFYIFFHRPHIVWRTRFPRFPLRICREKIFLIENSSIGTGGQNFFRRFMPTCILAGMELAKEGPDYGLLFACADVMRIGDGVVVFAHFRSFVHSDRAIVQSGFSAGWEYRNQRT
jgi:hypothetical protein